MRIKHNLGTWQQRVVDKDSRNSHLRGVLADQLWLLNPKLSQIVSVGDVVKVRARLTTLHRDLRRDTDAPVGFGESVESLLTRLETAPDAIIW